MSVEIVDFFDHVTKQKRYVFVYSPYIELEKFSLKFQNKKSSNIKGYIISLKEEKDKIYLEKEIFFNRERTLEQIFEENDRKNVIFLEYRRKIYPFKLKITKPYFEKIKNNNGVKFQKFICKTVFPTSTTVHRYHFEKAQTYISKRYPIIITETYFLMLGKVTFFISPELYAKNKSFLKYFREIGVVDVSQGLLNDFRKFSNDQKYSVSKIYKFKNDFLTFQQTMKEDDFVLPSEFKIDFKLKTTTTKISTTADQIFEKTFKSTFSLLEDKSKIKEVAPTNIEDLQGQSGYIKKLSEKVNLKSLTHAYENFFLYDLDNVIKPIFTTELQQEFSNDKLDLIRPTERLKFEFIKDVYKNKLEFELSKVHTKKSFNVVSNKVFNLLRTNVKNRGKKIIEQKRAFNREIIETIKISGVQNSDYNFLNPIYISIKSDHIKQKLTNFRKYRYRFVLESILLISNIENETEVIFVTCDGLNNVNTALINSNLRDTLGVCYLHEIKDWDIIKGQSKRSQAKFTDSEELTHSSHIAFAFTTKNFSDLLNFSLTLVDSDGNNIRFPKSETKIPIVNFIIQTIN